VSARCSSRACGSRLASAGHIDCAAIYGNEAEVGSAIKAAIDAGTVSRQDLFITSKLWNSEHLPEHVRPALLKTLADLHVESLDLYIIHWPQQFEHVDGSTAQIPRNDDGSVRYASVPLSATWAALEALVDEGLVRALGVSNFNQKQVSERGRPTAAQPHARCAAHLVRSIRRRAPA
jgi:alcohol dehydrogenase (NADP+)